MKQAFIFTILLCLFTGLLLSSCDDDFTNVGITTHPSEDFITAYTDTFQMKAYTVKLDSIFAKTSDCILGEMYDPVYGIIKADLLCQFYCEEGFKFRSTPRDNKIDSVELLIFHHVNSNGGLISYGDTLTPMQVTVYPINKPLKRNFYSNDQPEQYCDMQNPLGNASYTLYDRTIPDSIRAIGDYYPLVRVMLPAALGQKFYDETLNNPSTFKNQNSFNEFFPGIYITNTYGSGCLLLSSGENIWIRMHYQIETSKSDSFALRSEDFHVSKDVIQINRFKNSNIDQLLEENPTHTYIKSPAGVCTKLVLPTSEIAKKIDIKERFINGFTLNLKYLPGEEWNFSYNPPEYLLLLPEDSVTSFFEKSSVENDVTSYVSFSPLDDNQYPRFSKDQTAYGYSPYNRTYSFGNISNILKKHIENAPDKDLRLLVIPVSRKVYNSGSSSSGSKYYTTGISHSFKLAGVKIRTDEEFMKVIVLSSKYENRK